MDTMYIEGAAWHITWILIIEGAWRVRFFATVNRVDGAR
jgi:hypothetical protein